MRLIFDLYVHERIGLRRIAKELAERGITRKMAHKFLPVPSKRCWKIPSTKATTVAAKSEKLDMGERYVRRDLPESEWVMYKDPSIPAIVSEELWNEAAQIRMERKAKFKEEVSMPCNQGIYRYSGKNHQRIC